MRSTPVVVDDSMRSAALAVQTANFTLAPPSAPAPYAPIYLSETTLWVSLDSFGSAEPVLDAAEAALVAVGGAEWTYGADTNPNGPYPESSQHGRLDNQQLGPPPPAERAPGQQPAQQIEFQPGGGLEGVGGVMFGDDQLPQTEVAPVDSVAAGVPGESAAEASSGGDGVFVGVLIGVSASLAVALMVVVAVVWRRRAATRHRREGGGHAAAHQDAVFAAASAQRVRAVEATSRRLEGASAVLNGVGMASSDGTGPPMSVSAPVNAGEQDAAHGPPKELYPAVPACMRPPGALRGPPLAPAAPPSSDGVRTVIGWTPRSMGAYSGAPGSIPEASGGQGSFLVQASSPSSVQGSMLSKAPSAGDSTARGWHTDSDAGLALPLRRGMGDVRISEAVGDPSSSAQHRQGEQVEDEESDSSGPSGGGEAERPDGGAAMRGSVRGRVAAAVQEMQGALQAELQEDQLTLYSVIGRGGFGTVYHGALYLLLARHAARTCVASGSLHANACDDVFRFVVLQVMGTCSQSVVREFARLCKLCYLYTRRLLDVHVEGRCAADAVQGPHLVRRHRFPTHGRMLLPP